MRKKISYLRHFSIFVLTIVIFSIGIFIGGDVEQLRVQNLYTQLQQQDLSYQSIVTESNYIDYLVGLKQGGANVSCNTIKGAYYTSIKNLDNSRIKLDNYINSGSVKNEDYQRLKKQYANVQINYWILANKIDSMCKENMNPILYFYADDKKCPQCQDQGVHLSYVKDKLKDNVLIFSLDSEQSGAINLLAQKYGVYERSPPVLVIDGSVYGYMTNDNIFKILCQKGLNDSEVCQK